MLNDDFGHHSIYFLQLCVVEMKGTLTLFFGGKLYMLIISFSFKFVCVRE